MMILFTYMAIILSCCTSPSSSKLPNYSEAIMVASFNLTKAKYDDPLSYPLAVAEHCCSGQVLVTDPMYKLIRVLTSNLRAKKTLNHDCFSSNGPRDLAVTKKNHIIVVCSNGFITLDHHFDVILDNSKRFGNGSGQFSEPEGVDIDETGNIYIVDYGNYRVQVLGFDGSFIRQFGARGIDKGQFSSLPIYVTVCNDGRVAVSDIDGNVHLFTSNGQFLKKLVAGEGFTAARGLACDAFGNLLLSDISGKVVALNKEYVLIGAITGLREPRGLFVMSTGNILVTEIDGRSVKKFKIPQDKMEL